MTIKKRLIFTLAVALLALIFVGGTGLWRLSQAQQRFEFVQVNIIPSIKELDDAKNDVSNLKHLSFRYLLTTDSASKAAIEQAITDLDNSLARHLATYEREDVADDTYRKFLETDKANAAAYRTAQQNFLAKSKAGDQDGAKAILMDSGALDLAAQGLSTGLGQHNEYNDKLSHAIRDENNAASSHAFWVMIVCIVMAIVLSGSLGVLLLRALMRSLGAEPDVLRDVTRRVADGDLSPVSGARRAPAGSVLRSMGEMQESLVRLIGEVRAAADNIATGSSQIAAGNVDLSSRTEQQAASLQETAASMEQLTSTVKQNSDSAQQASALAAAASDVAQKGHEVVNEVAATMNDISESSTKIADITGLIEGIAFQTNILALNAAVEAARAGEQGRGFAVVASEVRSLAQRSSSAAKEIKDLIATSVQKILDGSALAGDAGKTMSEVTQAVARVTDIMQEIATASGQQSHGIEQVNQAIAQMDEVTQQNSALVEEAAAASQALEHQGRQLNESIAFFRLDAAASGYAKGRPVIPPTRKSPLKRHTTSSAKRELSAAPWPATPTAQPLLGPQSDAATWETF